MNQHTDFIEYILTLVMKSEPLFSEQKKIEIEKQIRHDWGGERPLIAKRAPMLRASKEKVRAEIGIKSVSELQDEHGVSRRTLYRWIQKN